MDKVLENTGSFLGFQDRFELLKCLGQGSLARVFSALDKRKGSKIAIKIFKPELGEHEVSFKRLVREVAASLMLSHPNTVSLFGTGKTDTDQLYVAMELLPPTTLNDLLQEQGSVSLPRAVPIMAQICNSLCEAHEHRIVHCGIKPSNIHVYPDRGVPDFIRVTDYGLAKFADAVTRDVESNAVTDLLFCMSPEQAQAKPLGSASDIYSLGVLFFRMVTGQYPFGGKTRLEITMSHIQKPTPKPGHIKADLDIHPRLEALILQCLHKDPQQRYGSIEALKEQLLVVSRETGLFDGDSVPGIGGDVVDILDKIEDICKRSTQETVVAKSSGKRNGESSGGKTDGSPPDAFSGRNRRATPRVVVPPPGPEITLKVLRVEKEGGENLESHPSAKTPPIKSTMPYDFFSVPLPDEIHASPTVAKSYSKTRPEEDIQVEIPPETPQRAMAVIPSSFTKTSPNQVTVDDGDELGSDGDAVPDEFKRTRRDTPTPPRSAVPRELFDKPTLVNLPRQQVEEDLSAQTRLFWLLLVFGLVALAFVGYFLYVIIIS